MERVEELPPRFIEFPFFHLPVYFFQNSSVSYKLALPIYIYIYIVQSTGAVEYTDCISAEGQDPTNECPGYDTKQMDMILNGEAVVMLELWEMRSTLSLPSLPDPLWHGVLAPDRVK